MSNSTPCTDLDYQVGDRFTIIESNLWFNAGELVELIEDDGSSIPRFQSVERGCKWYEVLGNVVKVKEPTEYQPDWDSAPEWAQYHGVEPSGRHFWFNLEPYRADGLNEFARGLDTRRGAKCEEIRHRLPRRPDLHFTARPTTQPEEPPVPDTTETTPNTIRYFIRREDGLDITAGKAYVVGSDGTYRDDAGDNRYAWHYVEGIYGEAKFIIRCLDAPNKSCVGKYIDEAFVPEVGNVNCEAEHKADAHQFTLPEVIEFLRFTRKKHDEQGKTSSFEVLLAPILCTFEGEFKKPEPVGTGGYKVGDRLICEASSHRGLLVGEEYVVYRIDGDDDECIEPAGPGRLALGARYAASGNSGFNEGCKFRKVELAQPDEE